MSLLWPVTDEIDIVGGYNSDSDADECYSSSDSRASSLDSYRGSGGDSLSSDGFSGRSGKRYRGHQTVDMDNSPSSVYL